MLGSLCGFPHRKDNLKQQNKQRKPIVSEKKPALIIEGHLFCFIGVL